MFNRMTLEEKTIQIVAMILITLLSISMLYPFVHLIALSFSTPAEALRPGIHLVPKETTLEAYRKAFSSRDLWTGFGNSFFRTIVGTCLSIIIMVMGAYPLSKKYLPHRNIYTMFIVITMFFSGGMIPTYLLVKGLGLVDSRWALIIPGLISTFNMIIIRNFFMSLPSELEESAKIDGAHDIRILFSIIVPLSKPILATVALWTAVGHWNAWFDALIYIQDQSKMVLQVFVRRLVVENQDQELQMIMEQTSAMEYVIPETIKAAVLMITTLPIILVYPFLQKYFVKGIMVGSLKG